MKDELNCALCLYFHPSSFILHPLPLRVSVTNQFLLRHKLSDYVVGAILAVARKLG